MRLEDRYDVESIRLKPETSARDSKIFEAVSSIGLRGTTLHLLNEVPDQFEDQYTVLIDAKLVVSFELLRGVSDASPKNARIWFLADYRREIGQGRHRIMLDRAASAAREISDRHISN